MKDIPEAIVVGGGPCGSRAAFKLAQSGVKVTVFEEHNQIGFPSHCAGHVSIKGLSNLGLLPLPNKVVENTFLAARFYSPNGNRFLVRFQSPVTCAIDRTLFDRHLAEKAKDAGAEFRMGSRVGSLVIERGFVKGVTFECNGRIEKKIAGIVIDAEGVTSRVLRQTGLRGLDVHMLVKGIEAEVENVQDVESDVVEVFLGERYAPGLYGWLIPKKDGKAKIGLGSRKGNPLYFLQKLMTKHPAASKKLHNARVLQASFHPITLGGPIKQACSDGFLAVGDAASQVKSTTGGGVVLGLTCTDIAADVAGKALTNNDVSATFLRAYQTRCNQRIGFDVRTMVKLKRILDLMPDKRLDDMIVMCNRLRLDKTLEEAREIDFQGQTLLHALSSPRMLTALGYFLLVYLSANL